jgi:hypothetical protein
MMGGDRALHGAAPPSSALAGLYDALNAQLWDGQLPPPVQAGFSGDARGVCVSRVTGRLRGEGLFCRTVPGLSWAVETFSAPDQFVPARIDMMQWLGAARERRTLLHGMVHFAIFLAGPEEEIAHGPRFVAELRRIGALGEL